MRSSSRLLVFLVALSTVVGIVPAAAQTAPEGLPPPPVAPMAPGHHSILALGDSDLAQGVWALPATLAQHGVEVEVVDGHGNGWGLLDPLDGLSAIQVLDRRVAEHPDLDTVVIGFLGVCAVACGPGKLAYGSQQFYDAWDAAARALVTRARLYGLQVVWAVSPPPPPAPTADPPVEDWSSLPMRHQVGTTLVQHARAYATAFGVATADMFDAVSDTNGQWQPRLSYDGAAHTVRLDDGVHLTEDGSRRTSAWTTATLAQLWSRPQVESVV